MIKNFFDNCQKSTAEFFSSLLGFVFPQHCPLCGAPADGRSWCNDCLQQTLFVHRTHLPPLAYVVILGRYRSVLRKLILNLKYHGQLNALPKIHAFLAAAGSAAQLAFLQSGDWLAVPVPLHKMREKKRGFNQAELIFAEWLGEFGIPVAKILERRKETLPQFDLSADERRENVRDAFAAKENADIRGKKILLLDDIITTGATLQNCADALIKNGASKVVGVVLAGDLQSWKP